MTDKPPPVDRSHSWESMNPPGHPVVTWFCSRCTATATWAPTWNGAESGSAENSCFEPCQAWIASLEVEQC